MNHNNISLSEVDNQIDNLEQASRVNNIPISEEREEPAVDSNTNNKRKFEENNHSQRNSQQFYPINTYSSTIAQNNLGLRYQYHGAPILQSTSTDIGYHHHHRQAVPILPECSGEVSKAQICEVLMNPELEHLLHSVFVGRQIGESQAQRKVIFEQEQKALANLRQLREELKAEHFPAITIESTEILAGCKNLVEKLDTELQMTQKEAEDACNMFENQIKAILSTANAFEDKMPVALSSLEEKDLYAVLKRRFGKEILQLSEEFTHKKQKRKLPASATEKMNQWWSNHLSWPYPSEDEKKMLAEETKLHPTQINNWFINQRKRHWHRLFKDGYLPQSPDEASVLLKEHGIIKK